MGLFSFIKNKGFKRFDSDQNSEKDRAEVISTSKKTAKDDVINSESMVAKQLEQRLKEFRLKVEKMTFLVDDDQVTITGKAKDQSTKEKVVLVLGNTFGIATVDDQMSVDHEVLESKFYTVVKGDSLKKISKQYYQDTSKSELILEANKPMLTDANSIYSGQVLRIPRLKEN